MMRRKYIWISHKENRRKFNFINIFYIPNQNSCFQDANFPNPVYKVSEHEGVERVVSRMARKGGVTKRRGHEVDPECANYGTMALMLTTRFSSLVTTRPSRCSRFHWENRTSLIVLLLDRHSSPPCPPFAHFIAPPFLSVKEREREVWGRKKWRQLN